ncbi:MAG TPA: PAS domain-containing protein [Opitutaceae bacterium]
MFATVFRFCPDAVAVDDAGSRIFIEANAGFEQLFGIAAKR